jgi:broad specificity phosphatase PhoE
MHKLPIQKEIFIIRHGQTEHNKKGIVQGKGVNLPLNETGQHQAQLFFNAYSAENFDVVYTSTLLRAQQTVNAFIEKGISHRITSALDEISWGDMEGKTDVMEGSGLFNTLLDKWENSKLDAKAENGESPLDVQARQMPFIDEIKQAKESKILVCMHGRAMRVLMCTLTNTDLSKMKDFEHANLTLYKVVMFADNTFKIELHNYQQHLHATT